MLTLWICCAESGDTESTDLKSLKNKTFNDESRPLTTPGLSTDETKANVDFDVDSEPTPLTDKMVSGNSVPFRAN